MIPALGALGGTGVLLLLSPLLWPASRRRSGPRSPSAITERLARAGFAPVSPSVFLLVSGVLAAVAGALVLAITALPAVALVAAAVAGSAPWTIAGARGRSRRRTSRALWPEVVDHLVASVRAGMPLPEAVVALGDRGPVQLRAGFAVFEAEWRASGTVGPALDAAKAHFADPIADRLLEVLRMAREVGGTELPSVLRDLSAHLRQDLALRGEVEARQSWVTNAGKLGLAAPWVVLGLLASRPEAAAAYATPGGTALIAGAAVVTLAAYRVMVAIGRLPEDRRWFR